jgi:hypothetical protein
MQIRQIPSAFALALLVVGCSSEPSAEMAAWSLEREPSGKGYLFSASANLLDGERGWFSPELLMTDERGCLRVERLSAIHPRSAEDPSEVAGRYRERFDYKWKVAKARLRLVHYNSDDFAETEVFREERVVDPKLRPPAVPKKACSAKPTRQELRERAKTDPDSADAEAIDNMSRNELVATAINSAGFLCARVTDMYPSGGAIVVTCVEYRNGSGRAKYRVDAEAGRVEQLD